ncbi:MAG: hypothetical protein ACR2RB_08100 [Gammaproteobacteria bacterium]
MALNEQAETLTRQQLLDIAKTFALELSRYRLTYGVTFQCVNDVADGRPRARFIGYMETDPSIDIETAMRRAGMLPARHMSKAEP